MWWDVVCTRGTGKGTFIHTQVQPVNKYQQGTVNKCLSRDCKDTNPVYEEVKKKTQNKFKVQVKV